MVVNATKVKLTEGGAVWGTFIYLSDPAVVEIVGQAGADFVLIDTEHMWRDGAEVANLIRAAENARTTPIVRVGENSESAILKALEAGAEGIVIPFVQSREDVERAKRATKYPPEGGRGACTYTRATRWGSMSSGFRSYSANANDNILLIGLIENVTGVDNIDEIVAAGLDVVFVGRRDLASSLGVEDLSDDKVCQAVDAVVAAAARSDGSCAFGIVSYDADESELWGRRGARFICHSLDVAVLASVYRRVGLAMADGNAVRIDDAAGTDAS